MCLAASQSRYLFLTNRKGDVEYNISINSMEKMALTRQQSDLSKEYYAKLKAKTISYYNNGQYNMMDYGYLMGNGLDTISKILKGDSSGMKKDNSMVLTDSNGLVVMSDRYAGILQNVLGSGCIDGNGRGGTFSTDKIPEILHQLWGSYSADDFKDVINNKTVSSTWEGGARTEKTKSGETVSTGGTKDNSDTVSSKLEAIVDFFYPIFQAAAANGWTTEYNKEMEHNNSYVSDALVTGIFQLEQIDTAGAYKPDSSLSYFVTSGLVVERTDSNVREEVTAWYNAEKEAISEKEGWLDLEISDLSTELEAINTEMESIKSIIQDAMNVFDWCTG